MSIFERAFKGGRAAFKRARRLEVLAVSHPAGRRTRRSHVDGKGFHDARLIAGLDRRGAAAALGVSERTVRNWESRRCRVPYSAFKLMRILSGYALPGEAWRGWSIRRDTLWSPEQKPFRAADLTWWGLTVAMARAWHRRYGVDAAASQVVAQVSITVADLDPESRGCSVERLGAGSVGGGGSRAVGRGAGRGAQAGFEGVSIPHCENCGSTEGVRFGARSAPARAPSL